MILDTYLLQISPDYYHIALSKETQIKNKFWNFLVTSYSLAPSLKYPVTSLVAI